MMKVVPILLFAGAAAFVSTSTLRDARADAALKVPVITVHAKEFAFDIPKSILVPVVLVLCAVGAYALNNTMDNVYVLALFGVVGYGLVKFGFPLAPLILGLILGDQIEVNLVRALMSDSDVSLFFTRPISGLLLALSLASVAFALWQHHRARGRTAGTWSLMERPTA